jgi:hypothetical protein
MYESVRSLFGPVDPNLAASLEDQRRVQAYEAYEGLYKNNPDTFKLVQRGEDDHPMYIPSAKKIIEATNRFLAVGWRYTVDKKKGTSGQQTSTLEFLDALWERERMRSTFAYQRRWGLIRGDAIWHFIADRNKPEGRRLTIQKVLPKHYFPIKDDISDPEKVTGVHLCNIIPDPDDPEKKKTVARRQTYRKIYNDLGILTGIESSLGLYELGKWDDRNLKAEDVKRLKTLIEPFILPGIMAIPVYHVPNGYEGDGVFGTSQLQGIETIVSGVNQTLSDEQLTLVMQGLGVYATTAGPALGDDGNETDYEIGPAVVLELPADGKIERISGVSSVAPMIDHMNFALSEAQLGVGVSDISTGVVDVQVAESGIALKLKLSPLLAQNKEKEDDMLGVYDQMLFDLANYWLPEFEQFTDAIDCKINFVVDDPMPVNRDAKIAEVVQLVTPVYPGMPPLITTQMAVDALTELGYEYPANAVEKLREDAAIAQETSTPDPQAERMNDELDPGAGGNSGSSDA